MGSSKNALLETVTMRPVYWRARTQTSESSPAPGLPISMTVVLKGERSMTSPLTPPIMTRSPTRKTRPARIASHAANEPRTFCNAKATPAENAPTTKPSRRPNSAQIKIMSRPASPHTA